MGRALVTKHNYHDLLPKKSKVILYLAISLLYSISFRILVALAYTISMCSLVMSVCSRVLLIEKQLINHTSSVTYTTPGFLHQFIIDKFRKRNEFPLPTKYVECYR